MQKPNHFFSLNLLNLISNKQKSQKYRKNNKTLIRKLIYLFLFDFLIFIVKILTYQIWYFKVSILFIVFFSNLPLINFLLYIKILLYSLQIQFIVKKVEKNIPQLIAILFLFETTTISEKNYFTIYIMVLVIVEKTKYFRVIILT